MSLLQIYILLLATLPFLFVAWVISNPLNAVAAVAALKRRFRRHIIQRHGKARAAWVYDEFRQRALKKGYDPTLIDEVFQQHKQEIIEYQGTKSADKFLGIPGPLERDF